MQLESVRVSGFRSLRKAELNGLKALNCLIGRNNSGKSALLDALLLLPLVRLRYAGLQAVPLPWPSGMDVGEWLEDSMTDHDAHKPIRLELDFVLGDEEISHFRTYLDHDQAVAVRPNLMMHYALEMRRATPGWDPEQLYLVEIGLCSGDDRMYLLRPCEKQPLPSNGGFCERLDDAAIGAWLAGQKGPDSYSPVPQAPGSLIVEAFAGKHWEDLGWFAQWATRLRHVRRDRHIDHTVGLDQPTTLAPDGSNLARFLQNMNTNETRRMRQMVRLFKGLVPWLEEVFTPVAEQGTTTRVAVSPSQDVSDAFALSNMGSGAIHVMIIAAMIWSMPDGGLALVEEPETGIHATAQRDLLKFLRDHCRATGKQIIFASHSPLFARVETDMASFVALYEPSGGTTFRALQAGGQGAVLAELGARMSDYFGYNAILLIEGETEEAALPPILDALKIDLETLGIGLVVLRGSVAQRLTRAKELVGMLAGTQTAPFVLVDADPGVPEKLAELEQQDIISAKNWWTWKRQDGGPGEFEDNFVPQELIDAANEVAVEAGQRASLEATEFEKRLKGSPAEKTSRVLSRYYWETYEAGLSKPRLGYFVAQAAAETIRSGGAKRERRYQFEEAFARLLSLLPK